MTQFDFAFIAAISLVIYATCRIVMWIIRAAARRRAWHNSAPSDDDVRRTAERIAASIHHTRTRAPITKDRQSDPDAERLAMWGRAR